MYRSHKLLWPKPFVSTISSGGPMWIITQISTAIKPLVELKNYSVFSTKKTSRFRSNYYCCFSLLCSDSYFVNNISSPFSLFLFPLMRDREAFIAGLSEKENTRAKPKKGRKTKKENENKLKERRTKREKRNCWLQTTLILLHPRLRLKKSSMNWMRFWVSHNAFWWPLAVVFTSRKLFPLSEGILR